MEVTLTMHGQITGVVSESPPVLHGTISIPTKEDDAPKMDGTITVPKIVTNADKYTGSYTVVPSNHSQTLETRNRVMTDNLTIDEIPYFSTSNESGTTVYIGG